MTTSVPRDPTTLSDPRVDAAWRTLSGEEPPESLDAAIMAAARREVGAAPQRAGAREALAARRRWWPLAAAATVAAIAVGVLQLTTPDQLGAPAPDKTIVTDLPAPAARPAPEIPATPSRADEAKPGAGNELRAERTPTREDSPRRPAPTLEARESPKRESARGNAPAMAEPFPAAPPQPAVAAAAAPAAAGQIATPAPPPQPAAAVSAQRAQESASARPTPLTKMAAGRAADAGADEARAKDRAPLPVADWIALIRRLRDEGKSVDAAKELEAFRVVHVDHEKLLPPDLRDWRPPEK